MAPSRSLCWALTLLASLASGDDCWEGDFTPERCCDTASYGARGDPECWYGSLEFEVCCVPSGYFEISAPFLPEKVETKKRLIPRASFTDAVSVSRSCWRSGFTFQKCCTRAKQGGEPSCWDGEYTFERCCKPPDVSAAGILFEDFQCERLDTPPGKSPWTDLQAEVSKIVGFMGLGKFREAAQFHGGVMAWRRRLASRWGRRESEGCDLGLLALALAQLLLCLLSPQGRTRAGDRPCAKLWDQAAAALRADTSNVIQWGASEWSLLDLFRHIGAILLGDGTDDPGDGCRTPSQNVDWPGLYSVAQAFDQPLANPKKWFRMLYSISGEDIDDESLSCAAGYQWQASIKLGWCIELTPQCVESYAVDLKLFMASSLSSGIELRAWMMEVGKWQLFSTQRQVVEGSMRHHYDLGLSVAELELLGVRERRPLVAVTCAPDRMEPRGATLLLERMSRLGSPVVFEHCRSLCGGMRDSQGLPWEYYGVNFKKSDEPLTCRCLRHESHILRGNCTELGYLPLYPMPKRLEAQELVATLDSDHFERDAPVLRQVLGVSKGLLSSLPVFVTMVFGHMASYLLPFARQIQRLSMQNVVVFSLDDAAERRCQMASHERLIFCVKGEGRTALSKYVIVLTFLALGRDVFWFDFDSIWLRSPLPTLLAVVETEERSARIEGRAAASIYSAIDFDSKNCPMNAFFYIRSTSEATLLWLLSLTQWIYNRPYAHDQLAWCLFLGNTVLVDAEPLPSPPQWAPLDPNVFGNAAKFAGLGFSSEVDDLVLFHFFDGWNSNMPSAVDQFVAERFKGLNIFAVVYGDDQDAMRAMIEMSRVAPSNESHKRDCSIMSDNGLGVVLIESDHYIPASLR